jgi:hypothetical protein
MPRNALPALTADERDLLAHGLREWGGGTRATDAIAQAIGFRDVPSLYDGAEHVAAALDAGEGLTGQDWARALIATEIAFASAFYGSGWDWSVIAGYDDEATIRRLRSAEWKLMVSGLMPRPEALSD